MLSVLLFSGHGKFETGVLDAKARVRIYNKYIPEVMKTGSAKLNFL